MIFLQFPRSRGIRRQAVDVYTESGKLGSDTVVLAKSLAEK